MTQGHEFFRKGNLDRARAKGRMAIYCNIAGVTFVCLVLLTIIIAVAATR